MTELTERGKQIRRDTLRLGIPNGIDTYGGSFSVTEILIALYDHVLDEADTVVVSTQHCWIHRDAILRENAAPANTMKIIGNSMLVGIETALARKLAGISGRVYAIAADGETQEGVFWETLLRGRQLKLDNLTVIVARTGNQESDLTEDTHPISSIALSKIAMYVDWASIIIDGHHVGTICSAFDWTRTLSVPSLIVASTIIGRGVSFMEDVPSWCKRFPTPDEIEEAYGELQ